MAALPERLTATVQARLHRQADEADQCRQRIRARLRATVDGGRSDLEHIRARVRALSPQATLDRGYAVVRTPDGRLVRDPADGAGPLRIRVAGGEFSAVGT